jgi:hypothetical protein
MSYIVEIPIDSLPTRRDSRERKELLNSLPFKGSGGEYVYNPISASPHWGAHLMADPSFVGRPLLDDMCVDCDGVITISVLQADELRTSAFAAKARPAGWELESSIPFPYRPSAFVVTRTGKWPRLFSERGVAYQLSGESVEVLQQIKQMSQPIGRAARLPDKSYIVVVDKRKPTMNCYRFALRAGKAIFCPDYREATFDDLKVAAALERALTALAK